MILGVTCRRKRQPNVKHNYVSQIAHSAPYLTLGPRSRLRHCVVNLRPKHRKQGMARRWIENVFGKFRCSHSNSWERVPHNFAASRKYVLTPSPSSTVLADSSVPANGPFFQRLPRELQLRILFFSFGDSIIHLELTQTEPRRLLGYYCQRNSVRPGKDCNDIVNDSCLWQRNRQGSDYGTENNSRNATIGALGWLMSCREA